MQHVEVAALKISLRWLDGRAIPVHRERVGRGQQRDEGPDRCHVTTILIRQVTSAPDLGVLDTWQWSGRSRRISRRLLPWSRGTVRSSAAWPTLGPRVPRATRVYVYLTSCNDSAARVRRVMRTECHGPRWRVPLSADDHPCWCPALYASRSAAARGRGRGYGGEMRRQAKALSGENLSATTRKELGKNLRATTPHASAPWTMMRPWLRDLRTTRRRS